jgi:capsular polysaccharide biosynthesis protein
VSEVLSSISADVIAAARLGRTWPQLWIKQELNKSLPPREGFEEFRRVVGLAPSTALELKPIRSLAAMALTHASDYLELEPAGERFVNAPPRVVGQGDERTLACTARSMYVAAFTGASMRGRSGLIGIDDVVLLDYEGDEYDRIDDEIELDSAVFRSEHDAAWIIADGDASRTLFIDEGFSLLGANSYAFGHWLTEYVPKLVIALQSGILPPVPILIDAGMARQHRQLLELLVPAGMDIIEVPPMHDVHAGRLWCAPTVHYHPVLARVNERFRYDFVASPPARYAGIFRTMLERMMPVVGPSSGTARIYLARKPGSHRKLVNRERIEAAAGRYGFDRVYLEDLDFVDQVRLLRSARFLVGPDGSAFFTAYFSRPGTKLCILNHPHTALMPTVTAPAEELGLASTVLTGPFTREDPDYPNHADYEIDEETFASFLETWLEEPTAA